MDYKYKSLTEDNTTLSKDTSLTSEGIKVVLGNGFDLFCGLKTRYIDFFNNEKDRYEEIRKWSKSFKDLKTYITQHSSNWSSFGAHYKPDFEFNVWDIYFALVIGEKDCNWCDIETEMLKTFAEKHDNLKWDNVFFIVENHAFNFSDAKHLDYVIAAYIIGKNIDISTEEKFYMFLYDELVKFEKRFGEYVNNEFDTRYDEYLAVAKYFFSFINNIKGEIKSIETFNYTDNRNKGHDDDSLHLNKIQHINGDHNNPIFGIDSSKIDVNSPKIIFSKVSRRLISSVMTHFQVGSTFDESFNHLIIFGHSLSEHDYNYFFPIFDYLEITDITKNSSLIFIYSIYDKSMKENIILNNIRKIICLIDSYEKYAGKNNDNRLIDSLTAQGRISLIEIKK